ncbi:Protein of unknown function [Cotesia congregata]|uniref:Uncharacterized protein n=1 Tax=Cotesia congregata TaxID=51543 RepID=A0A8J2HN93_COTCN|nr:Protein of unknown function [Cotesia congregata]
MIKPADLVAFKLKNMNNNKYDSLHLHVQRDNRRAVDKEQKNYKRLLEMSKKAQKNDFIKLKLNKKIQNNLEKYNLKSKNPRGLRELEKSTTDLTDYEVDYQGGYDKSVIVKSSNDSDEKNLQPISEEIEEAYDYELLKAEYEQQKNDFLYKNKTFNFTDDGQPEDTPKEFLKQLVQFNKPRNCTQEEIEKFGLKSFECLTFDYQNAIKNKTSLSVLLRRTWQVGAVVVFDVISVFLDEELEE